MKEFNADELMQREIEKAMQANNNSGDPDLDNELQLFEKLRAPFGKDAYSADTSRGFALTSLKAQYAVERLNEVLGFMNWSHGGEYEVQEDGSVLFKGALIVNLDGRTNRFYGVGYSAKKKNVGDAYKSAKTDSFSKCASQIGVGNDAFKGLVDAKTLTTATPTQAKSAASSVAKTATKTPAPPKKFERKSTKQVSSKGKTL